MPDDASQAKTSLPGDAWEGALERRRIATSKNIKILSFWFFGLHASVFFALYCGAIVGLRGRDLLVILLLSAMGIYFVSAIVAFWQGVTALWNAPILRWRIIALGLFPWMIIATEALFVFWDFIGLP